MGYPKCWMFVCSLLLLVPAASSDAAVPEWIPPPMKGGPNPVWVSAEQATTAPGELKGELFDPIAESNIRRQLESQRDARIASGVAPKESGDPCRSWIFIPPRPVLEEPTLEALLAHARLAVVGTVVDQKEGFYHGHPNSLLEVRVDKVLKTFPGAEGITSLYATFPHVEMKVGNEMLCMRSDRYPARPLTGKGIMIFAANIPDHEPLIVAPNTEAILFEDESGGTSLPDRFGKVLDPPAWSSIVKRVIDLSRHAEQEDRSAR